MCFSICLGEWILENYIVFLKNGIKIEFFRDLPDQTSLQMHHRPKHNVAIPTKQITT